MSKILIFVPLSEEMKYIFDFLSSKNGASTEDEYDPKTLQYHFTYTQPNRKRVLLTFVVLGGMGNLNTSAKLAKLLFDHEFSMVFLVGLAGALEPEVFGLGDVIISSKVKSYSPDKIKEIHRATEQFRSEGESKKISIDDNKKFMKDSFFRFRRTSIQWEPSLYWISSYLEHINTYPLKELTPIESQDLPSGDLSKLNNPHPKIGTGTIFSGDMVIDSDEYVEFLLNRNRNLGDDYYTQKFGSETNPRTNWFNSAISVVDMETLGFFSMAKELQNRLDSGYLFSIRGISDIAQGKSVLDESTEDRIRGIAVKNAIVTTFDLMEHILEHWKG